MQIFKYYPMKLKNMVSLDMISQIGIVAFGVAAIILVARKNKWGFVFGLASVPFWGITAYLNSQWGIFLVNIGYALSWIYGIYSWFKKEDKKKKR